MELDNNNMCGDEIKHKPTDEDCNKNCMDDDCRNCRLMVECFEDNGY